MRVTFASVLLLLLTACGLLDDRPGPLCDHGNIYAGAFSPSMPVVALAGRRGRSHDGLLKMYDLADGTERAAWLHSNETQGTLVSLAFSPDGAVVATSDRVGAVTLWYAEKPPRARGRIKYKGVKGIDFPSCATQTRFAADGGRLFVGCEDGTIHVVDPRSGEIAGELKGHANGITALALSADGRLLASAGGKDGTVKVWEISELKEVRSLHRGAAFVTDVAFLTDRELVAGYRHAERVDHGAALKLEHAEEHVRVWNVSDGTMQASYRVGGKGADSISVSAGRQLLAAGYERETVSAKCGVAIFDLTSGKRLCTIPAPSIGPTARWSPEGRRLVVGDGRVVELWNLDTPKKPRQIWRREWRWSDKVDTP